MNEVEGEISNITNLPATNALTTAENKTPTILGKIFGTK